MPNINSVYFDRLFNDSSKPRVRDTEGEFSEILNSNKNNMEDIFKRASKKYSVPEKLLKAVAKAESNFNPSAVSSAGAVGVMQLMPGTARGLGVKNSLDPEQNIMGGAKLLGRNLGKYKNLDLALAAYNAGDGNVQKYGGVPPFKETQNYIKKIKGFLGSERVVIPNNEINISKNEININNEETASLSGLDGEMLSKIIQIMCIKKMACMNNAFNLYDNE